MRPAGLQAGWPRSLAGSLGAKVDEIGGQLAGGSGLPCGSAEDALLIASWGLDVVLANGQRKLTDLE